MNPATKIIDDMIKELNPEWFIPSNTDSIVTSYLKEAKERIKKETWWISVEDRLPDKWKTFIYLTWNWKVMVASNRILDDWFIRKYSVTHWTYPIPLPPHK